MAEIQIRFCGMYVYKRSDVHLGPLLASIVELTLSRNFYWLLIWKFRNMMNRFVSTILHLRTKYKFTQWIVACTYQDILYIVTRCLWHLGACIFVPIQGPHCLLWKSKCMRRRVRIDRRVTNPILAAKLSDDGSHRGKRLRTPHIF